MVTLCDNNVQQQKPFLVQTTSCVVKTILLQRIITLGDVDTIITGFAARGFPNCGEDIDGTHIPTFVRNHGASDFSNRKVSFSIMPQALVDHRDIHGHLCQVVRKGA